MCVYIYTRGISDSIPNPAPCSESGAAGSQWRRYRHPWAHRRSSAFSRGCPPDTFVGGLNTAPKDHINKKITYFGFSGPSPGLLGACRKQGIEVWCWRSYVAGLMRLTGAVSERSEMQSNPSASFGQHVRIRVSATVSNIVLPGLICLICITAGHACAYNP